MNEEAPPSPPVVAKLSERVLMILRGKIDRKLRSILQGMPDAQRDMVSELATTMVEVGKSEQEIEREMEPYVCQRAPSFAAWLTAASLRVADDPDGSSSNSEERQSPCGDAPNFASGSDCAPSSHRSPTLAAVLTPAVTLDRKPNDHWHYSPPEEIPRFAMTAPAQLTSSGSSPRGRVVANLNLRQEKQALLESITKNLQECLAKMSARSTPASKQELWRRMARELQTQLRRVSIEIEMLDAKARRGVAQRPRKSWAPGPPAAPRFPLA